MPQYQPGDAVYCIVGPLSDPPSGDSPGCHLCNWADKLIIRSFDGLNEKKVRSYSVSHEHITDGRTFTIYGNEISTIKPLPCNRPSNYINAIGRSIGVWR